MVKDWAAMVGRGDIMLNHLNDRTSTSFVKAVYESVVANPPMILGSNEVLGLE